MSSPVAVVTGASSGIGLALTEHLLGKGWRVVLGDIQPPPSSANLDTNRTLYQKCDVSSWDDQASLFAKGFEWSGGRLDFAALNAGIDDRDDIFNTLSKDTPPVKPNMKTFDVDLIAVYWGVKLAAHYINRSGQGGHIAITASAAALYPHYGLAQYSACKAGCVGLVRGLAPLSIKHGIGMHALCPAFVLTNLAPGGLIDGYIKDGGVVTPMSTILRAYDAMIEPDEQGKRRTGRIVLASGEKLQFVDEQYAARREGAAGEERQESDDGDIWEKIYFPRNIRFAREWEEKVRAGQV